MGLLTPDLGLLFWMFLTFIILLVILGKFGWPVVMKMMKEREESIKQSLEAADRAKEEMKQLQCNNEQLLKQAQEERDEMLRQTKEIKEKMLEQAKEEAQMQAQKIILNARETINYEKLHAMTELKNQIANLSIEIAQDILQQELSDRAKSEEIIKKRISQIKL